MKILERKVHFVAEGTTVGCYDSKGSLDIAEKFKEACR